MTDSVPGSLYDYPAYYDLVFGSDWKAEFDFLLECFDEHVPHPVRRVFEPACGTGRLLYRLGKTGLEVSGLDLNEHAVNYCNRRLSRHGLAESAFVGDMCDFRLPHKVDAAFNTINSFRHLGTEKQATDHLHCVATALKKGGIYVLGLHLTPMIGEPVEDESWSARRGHLCVNTNMWLLNRNSRKRIETYAMTYDVHTPTQHFQLADNIDFRTYDMRQFEALLKRVPELQVAETYDFHYDINAPIGVGPATEDVVYILQRV